MNNPRQYAPFGIGHAANQFWCHIGSTSAPFFTLDEAIRYLNSSRWSGASAKIRNRQGVVVATKEIGHACVKTAHA